MGLMLNYMSQLTYLYGICFCKLAVGASLLRIASTKFWKHLVLGVMIFVFAYTTAGFVVSEISAVQLTSKTLSHAEQVVQVQKLI